MPASLLHLHPFWFLFFAYLFCISLCSVVVCVYDKRISKRNNVKLRIPEKSLFIWSALGGAVAMYVTMKIIRHKTKHTSFMVGIPLIILLQAALLGVLAYLKVLPPLF